MKLLLGLPEFTSGVDVNVRSWPFGRLPVVPGSRDLKDGFSRLEPVRIFVGEAVEQRVIHAPA
ncbi:hypothetical protein [Burkholderia cenocepacia]|uniref:hypothetical protein n=1 Tax=Burkholderia cenocepacia TaxID=95486 RepID=UPI002938DDD0|nr:hypothetical protein [Burkholderia cenocepacia]